jgi:hypothetical protein
MAAPRARCTFAAVRTSHGQKFTCHFSIWAQGANMVDRASITEVQSLLSEQIQSADDMAAMAAAARLFGAESLCNPYAMGEVADHDLSTSILEFCHTHTPNSPELSWHQPTFSVMVAPGPATQDAAAADTAVDVGASGTPSAVCPPPPGNPNDPAWAQRREQALRQLGERREATLHRPPRCLMDQMVSGSSLFPPRLLGPGWLSDAEASALEEVERLVGCSRGSGAFYAQPPPSCHLLTTGQLTVNVLGLGGAGGANPGLARDMLTPLLYNLDVRLVLDNSGSMSLDMFGEDCRKNRTRGADGWLLQKAEYLTIPSADPPECCGGCILCCGCLDEEEGRPYEVCDALSSRAPTTIAPCDTLHLRIESPGGFTGTLAQQSQYIDTVEEGFELLLESTKPPQVARAEIALPAFARAGTVQIGHRNGRLPPAASAVATELNANIHPWNVLARTAEILYGFAMSRAELLPVANREHAPQARLCGWCPMGCCAQRPRPQNIDRGGGVDPRHRRWFLAKRHIGAAVDGGGDGERRGEGAISAQRLRSGCLARLAQVIQPAFASVFASVNRRTALGREMGAAAAAPPPIRDLAARLPRDGSRPAALPPQPDGLLRCGPPRRD